MDEYKKYILKLCSVVTCIIISLAEVKDGKMHVIYSSSNPLAEAETPPQNLY